MLLLRTVPSRGYDIMDLCPPCGSPIYPMMLYLVYVLYSINNESPKAAFDDRPAVEASSHERGERSRLCESVSSYATIYGYRYMVVCLPKIVQESRRDLRFFPRPCPTAVLLGPYVFVVLKVLRTSQCPIPHTYMRAFVAWWSCKCAATPEVTRAGNST